MRYEYKCDECDYVEEVKHGIKEEPEIPCPKDPEHGPMRRLVGTPYVCFKGPGFTSNIQTRKAIEKAAKQARAEGMDI